MRPHSANLALLALSSLTLLHAQSKPAIDPADAQAAFTEAQQLSARDAGALWGKPLYGPILFVDPATRFTVANQPDHDGLLHPQGDVYTGTLPANVILGNTATEWAGTRWTMVLWPLPSHSQPRQRLLMHELFHRIQPDLKLPLNNPSNPQLDSFDGRYWLQLEWRALAAALVETGPPQTLAIRDALAFRDHRHSIFPGSAEPERALEMNEGLAEYTGVHVASPDQASARWRIVNRLTTPDSDTFVRSFAYASGPAYGLLLDQRLLHWRRQLTTLSDLALLLASTVPAAPAKLSADDRALVYGGAALRIVETEREATAEAGRAHYRKLLLHDPTLTLPATAKFDYGFDPNNLIPLGDAGTVFPTFQASDAWGTLDVKKGALVSPDFKTVILPAPANTSGTTIEGPGWTLKLAATWQIVPAPKPGSYLLQQR